MEFYFCYSGKSSLETEVIRELQPGHLLLSHSYFKNKEIPLLYRELGYKPKIHYNAGNGSNIHSYMKDIEKKEDDLESYFTFDVQGDNSKTFFNFHDMQRSGFSPIPVFQYDIDEYYLQQYMASGRTFIGLGGTKQMKSTKDISEWTSLLCWQYPEIDFHLLGSGSKTIINGADLHSATASTWIMAASYGRPKHIKGSGKAAKKERALYNMRELLHIPG